MINEKELLIAIKKEYEYQDSKYPNQKYNTKEWVKIALDELREYETSKTIEQERCEIMGAITSLIRGLTEAGNYYLGDCQYCSAGCMRNCIVQRNGKSMDDCIEEIEKIKKKEV